MGGGLLLAATATAALAGNGVGGVFNLGTDQHGQCRHAIAAATTATQQLRVLNTSTATGSAAVWGQANGGIGVVGSSTSRMVSAAMATPHDRRELRGLCHVRLGSTASPAISRTPARRPIRSVAEVSAPSRPELRRHCSTPATAPPAASSPGRTVRSASRRTRPAPASSVGRSGPASASSVSADIGEWLCAAFSRTPRDLGMIHRGTAAVAASERRFAVNSISDPYATGRRVRRPCGARHFVGTAAPASAGVRTGMIGVRRRSPRQRRRRLRSGALREALASTPQGNARLIGNARSRR